MIAAILDRAHTQSSLQRPPFLPRPTPTKPPDESSIPHYERYPPKNLRLSIVIMIHEPRQNRQSPFGHRRRIALSPTPPRAQERTISLHTSHHHISDPTQCYKSSTELRALIVHSRARAFLGETFLESQFRLLPYKMG